MPHSHHSHSGQFCKHAVGTLEAVVQEAISRGFEVYGLTEHVPRYRNEDLYPEEQGVSLDTLVIAFDAFLTEAHRLKELYADRIALLVGLETEYIIPADLDRLDELLRRHSNRIEFLVGSVHHVNQIPIDFDLPTYQQSLVSFAPAGEAPPSQSEHERLCAFLCAYFDAQYDVLQRFSPEIVGHIDLCRLYNHTLGLRSCAQAWAKLERNVRFAIEYGALFELNAAALRKGWSSAYPGEDVVELILKHGGRFALSDDSHGPHAVGLNYDRMASYARRVGINELWTLRASDTPNAGGRYLQPAKLEGSWWEHSFWEKLKSAA